MEHGLKINMPMMPNFLMLGEEVGSRQEGWKARSKISVGQLTDAQVEEFIVEWGATFRTHVANKRTILKELGGE